MPAERLSIRRFEKYLRLKDACGASERVIARSVRIARTAIGEYIRRAADLLAVTDIRIGEAIGLIVTTDYPPTVARLATASTKRVTEDCPPKNLRESDHHPISCTGGRSLSIWLRSSPRCWRGAKAQGKS
jgi:hypothetical protein